LKRVVVFFGAGGSNFLNLIEKEKDHNYKIIYGITNKKNSEAIKKANVPILVSEDFDEILKKLKELNPDLIVLAGFLKILPKEIIKEFQNKIINLHPSILPEFKGLNAHKRSFEAKKACGITIHYAVEELDSGDIILQYHINPENLSFEEFFKKLKKAEHTFLPQVVDII